MLSLVGLMAELHIPNGSGHSRFGNGRESTIPKVHPFDSYCFYTLLFI